MSLRSTLARLVGPLALALPALGQATIVDTGFISGGGGSRAWGISDDGQVVAGDAGVNFWTSAHAMRWSSSGGFQDLGDLPGGADASEANGISSDGLTIVGHSESLNGTEAFRWDSVLGLTPLGDLPGGAFESYGIAANLDGSWIVGAASDATGQRPVRWNAAGAIEILGALPGGSGTGQSLGINSDGTVIVGIADGGTDGRPFYWTAVTGMVAVPNNLPGMVGGRAEGVSDDGTTVVGWGVSPTFQYPFRYTIGGSMQNLGYVDGGYFSGVSFDCTSDGSVVVGSQFWGSAGVKATYWTAAGGQRLLADVLTNDYGLDLSAWELWVASAITPDGRSIAGYGYWLGKLRGFVVTLPPACPPPSNYCTSSTNSAGTMAIMGSTGSTSVVANDFHLTSSGGVPGKYSLFYYGGGVASAPFGNGTRCVASGGAGIFRLGPPRQFDASGDISRFVDNTAAPANAGPGAFSAGSTFNFQLWYRDPAAGGSGFNLSDGLSVTFCL